jgi:AraC family transcriptional regulator, transcriptional activator of pobA
MPYSIPYYNNLTESFSGSTISPSSPDFELLKFEEIQAVENRANKPFRLNAFVIGMITGGSVTLSINSKNYQLTAGSIYITNPWHVRKYDQINDWKGYIVFFTPQYLHNFRLSDNIMRDFTYFQTENGLVLTPPAELQREIEDLFAHMYGILKGSAPDRFKILFHYLNILLFSCKRLITNEPENNIQQETVGAVFATKLNNYFIQLYKGTEKEQLSLRMVAKEMHLHPNYLSNLLKTHTGKSAAQLIRERIMLEAQSLLSNTSMSISEIAYYLHFKDTSNFAKFFKSHCGKNPTQYREEIMEPIK